MRFYRQLMQKYLADKALIPAGSLTEVRFEDLERQPLSDLRRIEELSLPGFADAEPSFRAYVSSFAGYQKTRYDADDETIARVNENRETVSEARYKEASEAKVDITLQIRRGRVLPIHERAGQLSIFVWVVERPSQLSVRKPDIDGRQTTEGNHGIPKNREAA